ncbi:MAG: hypothetical protein WCL49_04370 [bacterium]
MSNSTIAIPRFRFHEPQNNLPAMNARMPSPEDRFTQAFARAYLAQKARIHKHSNKMSLALVQEIPVNGYGITDLLAIAWTSLPQETFPSVEAFAAVVKPTCRAFEMKLFNWQKALSQASRYRNFAHQAIVVLPPNACDNAINALDTFIRVRVGLWSFDPETGCIRTIFTPRCHRPRSSRYWLQSIEKASQTPRSVLPICEKG